jgi:hypothetical protein
LTGRRWISEGVTVAVSVLMIPAILGGVWMQTRGEMAETLTRWAPWATLPALVLKLSIAAIALGTARRRRLIRTTTIRSIVLAWAIGCGCLLCAGYLLLGRSGQPISWRLVLMGVAFLVPLGRFGLASLALDWNRHR